MTASNIMGKKLSFLVLIWFFLSLSFTACGNQNSKTPTPQSEAMESTQKGDKIPEQLTSIENNIEMIIQTLKGPTVILNGNKQQNGSDKGNSTGNSQSSQQSSQESFSQQNSVNSQQGKQEQGGQQGQSTQQVQKPQDPWETITPIINDMHYKWNSYMPLAAKKGASKTLLDSFGKALNSLTNTIIGKNSTNTLLAANYLYANIPDFYFLYRSSVSPEIKRIRYYTRNAMLNAYTANWIQADTDMNNLKSLWSLYKNTATKEQQDNYNKLDFSIYELEKAIKEKNQPITDIKGRVAMSNIEALEKPKSNESDASESGQGNESQSGGNSSSGSNSSNEGS